MWTEAEVRCEVQKFNIGAAENGVINSPRNIPKIRCKIWLTKYVRKMTLTSKTLGRYRTYRLRTD